MTSPESASEQPNSSGQDDVLKDDKAAESPAAAQSASGTAESAVTDTDELPEDEELTPELLEDEAIRGDFMLRWASVFLALLFGFSQIGDSRTLLHIRSGDEMRASGFLPGSDDPFSYANEAGGRSIANVSWLFDHAVSAVHAVGGNFGLGVVKALLAALFAWIVSRISVPGAPTWWNSVCLVLAIAACAVDFVVLTDMVTLLGLAVLLKWLCDHRAGVMSGLLWKTALLFAIWNNFDNRAWIGVLCIGWFALGTKLSVSRNSEEPEDAQSSDSSLLWKALGIAAVCLLINPNPPASLLSPFAQYSTEYPTFAENYPLFGANKEPIANAATDGRIEYYSLLNADTWQYFDLSQVSGVVLLVLAVSVIVLSASRKEMPFVMLLLGTMGLAAVAIRELPAAALIACVVASVVGQRWYLRTFRQEYVVDTKEIMFSRGGRAATVVAFAALAFLLVADRLPTRTPLGVGFESDLRITMDTVGEQLADLDKDVRILHTRIDHGDLLVWHGFRSFVDSRITPFGRPDDPNSTMKRYRQVRSSLLRPRPEQTEQPNTDPTLGPAEYQEPQVDWRPIMDDYGVTHVMPRLSPPGGPDFPSVQQLLRLGNEFLLESVGPSAALFRYTPGLSMSNEEKLALAFKPIEPAFREAETADLARPEFSREPDFYDRYIYRHRPVTSEQLRLARNYAMLGEVIDPAGALAMQNLALREAQAAITEEPGNASAYQVLGRAYETLAAAESAISEMQGGTSLQTVRYLQAVAAYRQAATLNDSNPQIWFELFRLYSQNRRQDLALECVLKARDLTDSGAVGEGMLSGTQRQVVTEAAQQMSEQLDAAMQQIEQQIEDLQLPDDPQQRAAQQLQLIAQLQSQGLHRRALTYYEENADAFPGNPIGDLLAGQLQLETGALEDARRSLVGLEGQALEMPELVAGLQWQTPTAVLNTALADYPSAIRVLTDAVAAGTARAAANKEATLQPVLSTLPLVGRLSPVLGQDPIEPWPLRHIETAALASQNTPDAVAPSLLLAALVEIEHGDLAHARDLLTQLVAEYPGSGLQPLAGQYLSMMLNEEQAEEFVDKYQPDLWEDFDFTDASEAAATGDQS